MSLISNNNTLTKMHYIDQYLILVRSCTYISSTLSYLFSKNNTHYNVAVLLSGHMKISKFSNDTVVVVLFLLFY